MFPKHHRIEDPSAGQNLMLSCGLQNMNLLSMGANNILNNPQVDWSNCGLSDPNCMMLFGFIWYGTVGAYKDFQPCWRKVNEKEIHHQIKRMLSKLHWIAGKKRIAYSCLSYHMGLLYKWISAAYLGFASVDILWIFWSDVSLIDTPFMESNYQMTLMLWLDSWGNNVLVALQWA